MLVALVVLRIGTHANCKRVRYQDTDAAAGIDHRDTRTPAKRNKRALETTKEETEEGTGKANSRSRSRSHSVSPPIAVGVSPRQEIRIRVRQISQGVEDLNWKTQKASDKNEQVTEIKAQSTLAPPAEVEERTSEVEDAVITDVKDENSQELVQQNTAPKDTDSAVLLPTVAPAGQAHVRSHSEGGEKGLKRRFGERGTSQGPNGEDGASKNAPEPLKRPRDDEGEDPNPREAKRPSPPPETKKSSPKPKPPSPKPAPKLVSHLSQAAMLTLSINLCRLVLWLTPQCRLLLPLKVPTYFPPGKIPLRLSLQVQPRPPPYRA